MSLLHKTSHQLLLETFVGICHPTIPTLQTERRYIVGYGLLVPKVKKKKKKTFAEKQRVFSILNRIIHYLAQQEI